MNTPWQLCKEGVDQLPTDYNKLIQDVVENKPHLVEKVEEENGFRVTIQLKPIQGYEVLFELIKLRKDDEIKRAMYAAYNSPDSVCYVRDLLVEDKYRL